MSAESLQRPRGSGGRLPEGADLRRNVVRRRRIGTLMRSVLLACTLIAMAALAILLGDTLNKSFGIIAVQSRVSEADLAGGRPVAELTQAELLPILKTHLPGSVYRREQRLKPFDQRSREELLAFVEQDILQKQAVGSWTLVASLLDRGAIEAQVAREFPDARLEFRSWVSGDFLRTTMSTTPALAGVRTAILGSLWVILFTMLIAIPVSLGAAIYLEEYATDTPINRIIQTNIANLAGVPSIIYGMLGLTIFVRALEHYTSGAAFGITGNNGRTVISASLTMALLILPLLIIASQEAIRAVPRSIRQASLGLGATKWQTIWHHVLPGAFPGILTGVILAMSRAIGETAPLIIVGASTYIVADPTGPFSKYTALPIQIFDWTTQPQPQFQNIAAAAIVVLLVVLLSLNSLAIVLRNRYGKRI